MNAIYRWIICDILGISHEPRTKSENRKNLWRFAGWGIVLLPWLVLGFLWL